MPEHERPRGSASTFCRSTPRQPRCLACDESERWSCLEVDASSHTTMTIAVLRKLSLV